MSGTRQPTLFFVVAAAAALAVPCRAQGSFGLGQQVYFVQAREFISLTEGTHLVRDAVKTHYYTRAAGASSFEYYAPLHLPSGARFDEMRCYLWDGDTNNAYLYLQSEDFNVATDSGGGSNLGQVTVTEGGGYQEPVVDLFDTTVRVRPTSNSSVFYELRYSVGTSGELLRGCEITWHRQSRFFDTQTPTFADVPGEDAYFQAIEALAASGITEGCGDGSNYCPDNPVTRAQLAAFLVRALGLHWPD